MAERKENFTPDEWTIHEYDSSIVIRDGKNMVCRCSKNANGKKYARFIKTSQEMYEALKDICNDCEKLSNWEDMFNIGRPEGSIMPKCPCDECHVKEVLLKADGEAFQEVKKRRRIADIAFEMYEILEHIEDVLDDSSGCGEISVEEIRKVLKKARGEE